jgi:hypothetical protein
MGFFDPVTDFAGDVAGGVKDGFNAAKDWVGDHGDDIVDGVGEALHTAAYGLQEIATAPINFNAHLVNGLTGKNILPEIELIGPSDTAKAVEDFISPVTDVIDYGDNLVMEFGHSALYAGLQQPYDGLSQLTNKIIPGADPLPQLDIIERPEDAPMWSPQWFAQKAGTAAGIAAPFLLTGGATGMIGMGSRLGRAEMALAGVNVTAESSLALRGASTVAGLGTIGFGYGFATRESEPDGNFWVNRMENGAQQMFSVGGNSPFVQIGLVPEDKPVEEPGPSADRNP